MRGPDTPEKGGVLSNSPEISNSPRPYAVRAQTSTALLQARLSTHDTLTEPRPSTIGA